MRQIIFLALLLLVIPLTVNAFAQIDVSEQTTLSENLENDPIAQDILKKIELTKQWIAELQQRNYEKIQAQKELEEKRTLALDKLNQDLADWEALWANYTSRAAFERFVNDKPSYVQGVFWDAFEFKEIKVKAGRDALKKVIENGGTLKEARQAYLKAAETKRIELIEANAQFNVKHGLAYYKQQLLFDEQGKFIDDSKSFKTLSQYYSDYRADPAYYAANLDDKFSYEDFGVTTPDTKCRDGFTVVHRFHTDDYVCVTYSTAEMWILHGMGEILGTQITSINEQNTNTPLVQCKAGFKSVYVVSTKRYSCVTEDTATKWIDEHIAQEPSIADYVLSDDDDSTVSELIHEINKQIQHLNEKLESDKLTLKAKYDKMYADAENTSKQEEKQAISAFNSNNTMTKQELSDQIIKIRGTLSKLKDDILDEKEDALKDLQKQYYDDVLEIRIKYVDSPDVKIEWNSDMSIYEAIPQ